MIKFWQRYSRYQNISSHNISLEAVFGEQPVDDSSLVSHQVIDPKDLALGLASYSSQLIGPLDKLLMDQSGSFPPILGYQQNYYVEFHNVCLYQLDPALDPASKNTPAKDSPDEIRFSSISPLLLCRPISIHRQVPHYL